MAQTESTGRFIADDVGCISEDHLIVVGVTNKANGQYLSFQRSRRPFRTAIRAVNGR